MIITIDTSKDSSEDIRKAADFLKMLAEGRGSGSAQAEFKASDDSAAAFGNLFGGDDSGVKIAEPDKKKKAGGDDEIPEIIVY